MELHNIAVQSMATDQHVVICGYGRSGQNLARLLEKESVPFIALDLDPQRIREAAAAGESVVFGDAARREVLVAAGLLRAKALAITYADTASALRILSHVQELRPGLPVVVRTVDDTDIDQLKEAGAAEVVAEIMEGSLMLASTALMLLGVPLNRVLRAHPRNPRAALQPVPRLLPRHHGRDGRRGRGGAAAAAFGDDHAGRGGDRQDARRDRTGRTGRGGHRGAPAQHPQRRARAGHRVEEGDVLVLLGAAADLAAAEIKLMQG